MAESPLKESNIPQLSYDIIARILPGFFVLATVVFSTTIFTISKQVVNKEVVSSYKLLLLGMAKIEVGFFDTIAFLITSYLLGWIFYKPDTDERKNAKDEVSKELQEGEPSLREMYHQLRMTSAPAGQRLLKLRAEVRMWEALRRARPWAIFFSIALIVLSWFIGQELEESSRAITMANITWAILKIVVIFVIFFLSPLQKDNIQNLWKKYWDDIVLHYRVINKL